MNKLNRVNPEGVPGPVGNYSHVTRVPKGAGLVVTSGQVGVDSEGKVPDDFNEQVSNTFLNIRKILKSEQLTQKNIIKINVWATEQIDWDYFYKKWDELFTSSYPSMTIAYITALGLPELKIEIEVWCASL